MSPAPDYFHRAQLLFLGEFVAFVTLSMLAHEFGRAGAADYVFAGVLVFHLVTAWHFALAAKQMGRSPWAWGLLASVPPGAMLAWLQLRMSQLAIDDDRRGLRQPSRRSRID
ncbi:hypothetical protein LK996_02300 [Lysobacter sp. A6]|uniref:DUF3817 domain-containing protein n=1 Tax=Noviluteimonas lactosilytica TaxID=2888523 RepID=A0ABS8JE85_9GAMM|nr:hypothetical protein [Lysobacter lactosilyticus]MCC8361916.1 hypothetical protein [Lysobacter lactosilyticus]